MQPTHTLCFLTRADQVLMLKRRKPPNRGLWNGVGGRIESGESPLAACLREVYEETGFRLRKARFGGLLAWQQADHTSGGVYLYAASAPAGEPTACLEGDLRWQPREWVLSSSRVAQNIHIFGPPLLSHSRPREYFFEYRNDKIFRHEFRPLPEWIWDSV